jgi:hypothetical protein
MALSAERQDDRERVFHMGDGYLAVSADDHGFISLVEAGHKLADGSGSKAGLQSPIDIHQWWRQPHVDALDAFMAFFWTQGMDCTFLDIGANVGLETSVRGIFARRAGQRMHIFAFEPGPAFPFLERTIELNELSEATAINAAVSNLTGTARFTSTKGSTAGGTLSVRPETS